MCKILSADTQAEEAMTERSGHKVESYTSHIHVNILIKEEFIDLKGKWRDAEGDGGLGGGGRDDADEVLVCEVLKKKCLT